MSDYWLKKLDELNQSTSSSSGYWENRLYELEDYNRRKKYHDYTQSVSSSVLAKAKKKKEEEKEEDKKWYQKGRFEDGYDFGDVTKTILGISDKKELKTFTAPETTDSLEDLKKKQEYYAGRLWNNAEQTAEALKVTQQYNQMALAQYSETLSKTKMDGQNHTVLEEIEILANMKKGKEKDKRKDAVLKKMEELGMDTAFYSHFAGDGEFDWGTFGKWIQNASAAGLNSFNKSLLDTADVLLGAPLKAMGWENNPISKGAEYYGDLYASYKYSADILAEKLGGGAWNFGSDAVEGTVGALPNTLLLFMTGGTSATATTSSLMNQAAMQTGNILTKAGLTAETMLKNPQFWMSFGRTLGGEYKQAKEDGASDTAAAVGSVLSAMLQSGLEIGLDGGSGIQGLPDGLKGGKPLMEWVESSIEEGGEEILQKFVGEMISKFGYGSDKEILNPIEYAKEGTLGVISGAALGGGQTLIQSGANAYNQYQADKLTDMEQSVLDKLVEKSVANKETDGKKLTASDKKNIQKEIERNLRKGYISAEDIEEAIGGDAYEAFKTEKSNFFNSKEYKSYTDDSKRIQKIEKQLESLANEPNTVGNSKKYDAIQTRLDILKKRNDVAKQNLDAEAMRIMDIRNQMRSQMMETVKGSRLAESYNELARSKQKFEVDVNKYTNENAKKTVQSILDSGLGDNSNQFHETVEWLAKLSEDRNVTFDLTKTERLKGTKHYKEGYVTNGFKTKNGDLTNITVNLDGNYLNTTVGHEITHVLEEAGIYEDLSKAVKEFAISKEGQEAYQKRLDAIKEIYGDDQATIDSELTADIIGEYLFTDYDFVHSLSTSNRNVFLKIYDEIKYLYKIATAGSKEARELEKVKKLFDQAWKENVKGKPETQTESDAETRYSLVEDQETIDFLENQEHLTVYKAMSMVDGKLYPPMASQEYVDEEVTLKSGKKKVKRVRKLKNPSELGKWQQSEERPDLIKSFQPPSEKHPEGYGKFDLLKSNGKTTGDVAYNPYEHTSNIVLNDQFSEAYQRPELVTVEYRIPVSELTSGYKAKYAKDPVGLADWKAGGVAQKLKNSHRDVYLTRWSKPVRVLSDAEVAQKYKEILDAETGISVPWNVVTPSLRMELEKIGVPVDHSVVYKGKTFEQAELERQQATQYSVSKDSEGRDLTAEQSEFFKDSKIRDENGNLKVMYHGTPNGGFTVFKDGTYFTDNKEYADRYQNPSASSIGFGKVASNPKTFEVYLDIKKPFDINDPEARRIYINEYIKGGNAIGIDPYLPNAEYAKIKTIDWTEGEDLRDFLIENEYDYDGLVLDEGADGGYGDDVQSRGTSWVVFSPEQVKNVDNTKPTSSPDIRYSMTKEEKAKLDKDYLDAVEKGDEEVQKHLVREYARASMPDSKLVDENGNLRMVYHGTNTGDFTVFNPDYIGMSSGDDGFFGMGFYFAYSKGEAKYYGAKRVIPAYLNLTNPFNFDTELQTYNGKKALTGKAPDAVALMNFADKFPDIAMHITLGAVKNGESTGKSISVFEFAKAYKDVIENKEFEYQELVNEYGESETLVTADPQIHEYEYNGETHSYRDYGFQKRWYGTPNELDVAYEYLSNAVYSYLDIPRRTNVILDNNREFTEELKSRGYDGAIQSTHGDEAVAFYPNQIKSAEAITKDNDGIIIPLSKRFDNENDDIRYSVTKQKQLENAYQYNIDNDDMLGAEMVVEQMADLSMPDSKIRDENGKLIPVYHGTNAQFWEFDTSADGGKNGTAEGFGIYLSDNQEVTNAYGDRQIKMFANITKPATSFKKTIKTPTLVKLIKQTCERQAQQMVDEEGYDSIRDAIRDTWVSNYEDTYSSSMDSVYRKVASSMLQQNDNDKDIIHEVMFGMAIRSYDQAMDFYRNSLTPVTGIDGFITKWDNANTGEQSNIYLAFDSSQLKSADAVTKDENGNIIPLSERFDFGKKDIRYSISKDGKNTSGDWHIDGKDFGYNDEFDEFAPIRDDVTSEESSVVADKMKATADETEAIAPEVPKQKVTPKKVEPKEKKDIAKQRREKSKGYTEFWANLIGDTSTWVDMPTGLHYKTKTLRRILRNVVRDASGKADIRLADTIYDALETKYDHNEAKLKQESQKLKEVFKELNLSHAEDEYAQMLGELRYNPETTLSEDVVKDYLKSHKIDEEKVNKAIAEARKLYDDLIVRVNGVLTEQGFKEIPYRQGYFPHFTNPKQNWLQKALNWKVIDNEIPTSIAGLTEMFKPNRTWQKFDKHRTGDKTDYSLYQGLDTYIHGALDWIYHIEDLQERRSLENYIRYTHSDEGVKQRIEEIQKGNYDAETAQQMIDAVLAEANNPLSGLVRELMNRTNTLANKKSSMDRGMEDMLNRKIYSTLTNLNNRITANQVVGSLSSAMTNFIPMVQSWHQVSPVYTVKGMGDYIRSVIKDDGMVQKSDFLTNRLMEEEKLFKTGWDKVTDKAGIMMSVVDSITSQTVWRSKYLQNLSEGMSENQAIRDADQFAKNLMAGRSRGNAPTIFDAKNPLVKIFTAFQLEVANQYGYMFDDVVKDSKNKARLVKGYATAFLGAYAYNALYSSLVGRDAAFDPISIIEELMKGLFDDEEEPEDVLMDFGKDVLEEVPFVGGLLGGGRIPMSSAFPYSGYSNPIESMLTDVSEGKFSKEWLKPLYYLAMPVGGGQIKKTVEGLSMFSDDHPISGSYTDSSPKLVTKELTGDGKTKEFKLGAKFLTNDYHPFVKIDGMETDSKYYIDYENGVIKFDTAPKGDITVEFMDSNMRMRFPVEDNFGNKAKAALFGQYASKNARDYFDNNRSSLNTNQIKEYMDLDIPIADYWEYRDGLRGLDKIGEKADYIDSLDLPIGKKNLLINNLADRKTPIDMTDYGEYDDFEEFDWATKNPEKYEFFSEMGITYKDYKDADEDTKDDYNWAFQYPQYYTLSKAVTSDVLEYRKYYRGMTSLKADKDANGKSISGSKKAKVIDYINGLDIEYGAKLVLLKSQYESIDEYNEEIFEYIRDKKSLTFEEKMSILKTLGFGVSDDGTITWD